MSADEAVAALRRLDRLIDELAALRSRLHEPSERPEYTAGPRPVSPVHASAADDSRR